MFVINEQVQITERLSGDRQNALIHFPGLFFYVLATCVFGGKGNSRGNASVSVGEGWPPHSITEVSGFKPQSALKRPQTKTRSTAECQVGIFLIFFRRKRRMVYVVIVMYIRSICGC